ncbi:MAG: 50S ribosomal protein L11 methyltransferase [Gammaproteobacteria bacterium]|nr:50S ribosomal protein L11 methyltransferase [Gammaproteobacteria bacterium]
MSWLQIAIHTTKDNAELAEDCLFSAGAQTVTLTDGANQPILEPAPDEIPVWNTVIVTGLFSLDANQQHILGLIEQNLGEINYSCKTEILEDRNWARAWMDHYQAMRFGKRLWVCPLHLEPPDPAAINLRLDPGLAFGTGTHPTTSLCLRWLDQHIPAQENKQQTLLDYGCGSGILAIAACMLGIKHADAVDIDPQALIATQNNAKTNQVNDYINTWLPNDFNEHHAALGLKPQYDIVVANILSGPLVELAPVLASYVKSGGDIVLSGILKEQAEPVRDAYSEFFTMDKPVYAEDWTLLQGKKT